jgi:hypothetical protein
MHFDIRNHYRTPQSRGASDTWRAGADVAVFIGDLIVARLSFVPLMSFVLVLGLSFVLGCDVFRNAPDGPPTKPALPETQTRVLSWPADDSDLRAKEASRFLALRLTVDGDEYRVGDPIRIEVELRNRGNATYSLVLPDLRRGPAGFGIRLTRGPSILLDSSPAWVFPQIAPIEHPFVTVLPKAAFHSETCFQNFSSGSLDQPLAEGQYTLTLVFDPSFFQDVYVKGERLLVRMQSEPVHFRIKGPARTDPHEILQLVDQKARIPHLEANLISQGQEQDDAWNALLEWGDSRLQPFLEHLAREHSEIDPQRWKPDSLRPFNFAIERGADASKP